MKQDLTSFRNSTNGTPKTTEREIEKIEKP